MYDSQIHKWRQIPAIAHLVETGAILTLIAHLKILYSDNVFDHLGKLTIHELRAIITQDGQRYIYPVKSLSLQVGGLPDICIDRLDVEVVLDSLICKRVIPCQNGYLLEFENFYISVMFDGERMFVTKLDLDNRPILGAKFTLAEMNYINKIIRRVRRQYNVA